MKWFERINVSRVTCPLAVWCVFGLFGCGEARCGPGTVLQAGYCVIASVDGSAEDGGTQNDGGTLDGSTPVDGSLHDARIDAEPPRCSTEDRSLCNGDEIVDCASGARVTTCRSEAGEQCLTLVSGEGLREAFCGPVGATPCDSTTYANRCDGNTLTECLRRADSNGVVMPGWIVMTNCAGAGGTCSPSPVPRCEFAPCDTATYVATCTPDGDARFCAGGEVVLDPCGDRMCRPSRLHNAVHCFPPSATESSHASLAREGIGCANSANIITQYLGYQWSEPCEPTVVRDPEGGFMSVPTTCVSREGSYECLPAPSYRGSCTGSGWSCASDRSIYCAAGVPEEYACAVGCDPDSGRCVAPSACDPGAAAAGLCLALTVAATCLDQNSDGEGWMGRRSCPNECTDAPFACD